MTMWRQNVTFVPFFCCCLYASPATSTFCVGAENEPEGAGDDWMRIAELQARNKACLPHLKSSYPVESGVSRERERETDRTPQTHSHIKHIYNLIIEYNSWSGLSGHTCPSHNSNSIFINNTLAPKKVILDVLILYCHFKRWIVFSAFI